MLTRCFDWFCRDRAGRVVIGQWPNWSLGLFGLASLVAWIAGPANRIGSVAGWIATVALIVWAADEVLRGVNPWRRCLGAAVLIGIAATRLG